MTDKPARTKNPNSPLTCASAAERIVTLIAELPDEAAVKARILREVAEQKTATQAKVSALVSRVQVGDREKLGKLIAALLDGTGTCGIAIEAGNDAVTLAGAPTDPGVHVVAAQIDGRDILGEVPERLRQPLSPEREAVGRKR